MKEQSIANNLTVINTTTTDCLVSLPKSDNLIFVKAELSSNANQLLQGTDTYSGFFIFKAINTTRNASPEPIDLSQCHVSMSLPLSTSSVPLDEYKKFKSSGIDFYDVNDPAFSKRCYNNDKFEFDLTQSYRRNNLFKQTTFTSLGDNKCDYVKINTDINYVELNCDYTSNRYGYKLSPITLESLEGEKNLVFDCAGKTGGVGSKNIGLYLYLVMIILIAGACTLVILLDINGYFNTKEWLTNTLKHDELINDKCEFQHVKKTESEHKNTEVVYGEIQITFKEKIFKEIFLNNLFSLHPCASLFYSSVLFPLVFKVALFGCSFLNFFGYAAMFFTNSYLDKRITNSNRDSFGYPVSNEFLIILYSLIVSLVFTVIIKAIMLISPSLKDDLKNDLMQTKNEDETMGISVYFNKSFWIRRIISGALLLVMLVFNFYCSIMFCAMYRKAQYGWATHGFWIMFFDYLILAPIYIVIVSLIEYKTEADGCIYCMKAMSPF
jgi:hypothetical protein